MDTVTGPAMALAMENLGGLGIIHRALPPHQQRDHLKSLKYAIGCIGVGENGKNRFNLIKDVCHAVLIDIAHGHSHAMIDQIKWIKHRWPDLPIIAVGE